MSLYVVKSGDRTNPLGEIPADRLKNFDGWLMGVWPLIDAERTRSKSNGGTYKDAAHMRTVNAWHALHGTVLSWKNTKHDRPNGTDPQREFQISMIGNVIGTAGALRFAGELGDTVKPHDIARLTVDYNTAVMVLVEYANIPGRGLDRKTRTELVRAAGEDQEKVILAALTV